jgi:cell division septation protein DedD
MGLFPFGSQRAPHHSHPHPQHWRRGKGKAAKAPSRQGAERATRGTVPPNSLHPEVRRARRRLLGAIVLLVAVGVVLLIGFGARAPAERHEMAIHIAERTPLRTHLDNTHTVANTGPQFATPAATFSDLQHAHAWMLRLKQARIPAYLERRKQANGSEQFLVRAGPFKSRESAIAVLKQMRAAGLTSSANDNPTTH